jgi:Trk-type K+ transport system membrane component
MTNPTQLNDPTVTSLPGGFRFLAGLFQAAATRTAGFAVVNIAELHPAIQVSYLIMMYISIFPIAMSMRQTNVYEEKSLGVWADENDDDAAHSSYLSHHLRRQLSFDLWFVFLGFFLIAIVEGKRLENTNEYAFSLFSVLFEIVSAYGTVGLSLGFPGTNASFSAQFKTLSKLIIIAMQIRGRHRGLPYALDRAILLPSESLHEKENEDATRRARRGSNALDMVGMEGISRTGTGLSRRSSVSGDGGRSVADRFRPKQLKRIISGAFSAGPSVGHREKRA